MVRSRIEFNSSKWQILAELVIANRNHFIYGDIKFNTGNTDSHIT